MRNKYIIATLVAAGIALATPGLKAQTPQPGDSSRPSWSHSGSRTNEYNRTSTSPDMKASSLIGMTVNDKSGTKVGKIQDLIVRLDAHSVPFAIVEYGGALGIGETKVAVPLSDLSFGSNAKELTLNTTKDQFQASGSTPTGAWAAIANEDWAKNVDRFYGEPSTSSRFEREEVGGTEGREPVREPSQGNGASRLMNNVPGNDQALTTQVDNLIRKQAGDQSSDIKATVKNGIVTLKGKVASDSLKQSLQDQIQALPGVQQVDVSQLTPKY
jgi:sporulation protein YlmC with PRC-barrel domain